MDKYKNNQNVYSPEKKKYVPLWRLDIDTITVTHFNPDTLTEEVRTYSTDYIGYHIHYCDSKYPDYIRRLVNEGKIIQYLDSGGIREHFEQIGKLQQLFFAQTFEHIVSSVSHRIPPLL